MGKKKGKTIPAIVKRYDYPHGVPEEKNGAIVLEGFTLHPPKDDISLEDLKKKSGYVTEFEFSKIFKGETDEWLSLLTKGGSFKETKNPVYLIEAFLIAHSNGLYPPMWVLNFMADVFKRYHDSFGGLSLDGLFGFIKWKGQEPPFKTVFNKERDGILMLDIFRLTLLGFSAKNAAEMVSDKLSQIPKWDKTGLKLRTLSAEKMESLYSSKWKKIYNNDFFVKVTNQWLEKNKDAFLKSFPVKHFSPHRKKR